MWFIALFSLHLLFASNQSSFTAASIEAPVDLTKAMFFSAGQSMTDGEMVDPAAVWSDITEFLSSAMIFRAGPVTADDLDEGALDFNFTGWDSTDRTSEDKERFYNDAIQEYDFP